MFDTLFIAASFFGYADEIKSELERQGRRVIWFEDRPAIDASSKALLRIAPALMRKRVNAYCESIIQSARQYNIRDVLIIKGEALSLKSIQLLRQALPGARFLLYYWDSYRNMPSASREKVALVDRAFTFDIRDAQLDRRLRYRPLFYLRDYENLPADRQDIDILFLGTAHSDRYAVLQRLEKCIPSGLRFERILYVPSKRLFYVRKLISPSFWHASSDEFRFSSLKKSDVLAFIRRSRIVVDVERAVQTGYTMRTIEMFGASRKLITTNPLIEAADFYHPDNQAYVDRKAPRLSESFLYLGWNPKGRELLPKYSLAGWVEDVMGG